MVAETTRQEVASWNVDKALKMSEEIKERHGARPYGFRFTTMKRGLRDFEPKEIARSGMYYVNCKVQTLEEIEKTHNPAESTLLQNMKTNGWDKIVIAKSGWAWSQPLRDTDIVL